MTMTISEETLKRATEAAAAMRAQIGRAVVGQDLMAVFVIEKREFVVVPVFHAKGAVFHHCQRMTRVRLGAENPHASAIAVGPVGIFDARVGQSRRRRLSAQGHRGCEAGRAQ